MLVTAINRTNDMILVGHTYLLPGEGRRVTIAEYAQAHAAHGVGLISPDAPDAALLLREEAAEFDADDGGDEPEVYSLDVLDGDADGRDLYALTRAELAELARTHGLVPGRMTKRELIEAIHEYAE